MKNTSTRKKVAIQRRTPHARKELTKEDMKEDKGMSCPDCRELMTEVISHAFKWECRCLPGIHFCE
jgi:hypothetical protein